MEDLRSNRLRVADAADRAGGDRAPGDSSTALEFRRERLQALFDYSVDAIVLTDDNGHYLDVNPAACDLLGVPRDVLLASRAADGSTLNLGGAFDSQWRAFLTAGEQSGEYALPRPDGTTRDIEFRAVAHVLPGTHLSILRDVTERTRLERGRLQYVRRLEILSAIDRAILDVRSPIALADSVVRAIGALFPAIRVSLIFFDRDMRTARHVAVWSDRPTRVGVGTELPMRDEVLGPDVLQERSVIRSHLDQDAGLTPIDRLLVDEGVRSLLHVPLRRQDGFIGALTISSADGDGFDEAHVVIAREIADRVAIAIGSARLFEDLEASAARLAAMSTRLVQVQEIERRDIARELHDEIGQTLTGLKLRLDLAVKQTRGSAPDSLSECAQLVQDLVSRVRRLSLNLRPPLLDDFGLRKALVAHFERYSAQTSLHVTFSSRGLSYERLPVVVETAAFRVVQESLTNVARHAGGGNVEVDVRVADDCVHVTVTDHGRGFDTDAPAPAGAGLTGKHERVAQLGGTFQVSSAPGAGTRVEARIPLPALESGQP
jgi:PAS domain S-box-containing protein